MNGRATFAMDGRLAPLVVLAGEHRLIERMLALMAKERDEIRSGGRPRVRLIRDAVDFFRIYVDLCHHAKEERTLFRALRGKDLSLEHRFMLDAFVGDHIEERKLVFCLKTYAERYAAGDRNAAGSLGDALDGLITLVSGHMALEERLFVHALAACFNEADAGNILKEFHECDMTGVRDKYKSIVEKHEITEAEEARKAVLSNRGGNWYSEGHGLQASAG